MGILEYYKKLRKLIFAESGNFRYSFRISDSEKVISKIWGDWPQENEYLEIKSINFTVNSGDVKKINNYPDFLSNLLNLEHLALPIDMFQALAETVPLNIKSLILHSPIQNGDIKLKWPELVFENLVFLSIPELLKVYHISPENLPKLNWLEYDLHPDKKGEMLKNIPAFKNLKHITFSHARNLDVFTPLKEMSIATLDLFACTGPKFPVNNVVVLKDLEFLGINNVSVSLDLENVIQLPKLKELDLKNLKKLENIEALVGNKNLKGLWIHNCKNIDESLIERLRKNGYDFLRLNSKDYV